MSNPHMTLSADEEFAAAPTPAQLRYARRVIDGLNAFGSGLIDHDRDVFIASVIAKARRDGRIAERAWLEWK